MKRLRLPRPLFRGVLAAACLLTVACSGSGAQPARGAGRQPAVPARTQLPPHGPTRRLPDPPPPQPAPVSESRVTPPPVPPPFILPADPTDSAATPARRKPVFDGTLWKGKPNDLIPGTLPVFILDRAWRADENRPDGPHDMAKWRRYLTTLPPNALVIIDEEYLHDIPRLYGKEVALREFPKRVLIHQTLRELRPDLVNADCFGPAPSMDSSAVQWNDAKEMEKWRACNDLVMPLINDHLKAIAIELYFCPRPGQPVRGSYFEDYKAVHTANVQEARRHAQGRPVIGCVWLRTKGDRGQNWSHYVGDDVAWFMLDQTARMCDAVVIWDAHFTETGQWRGRQQWDPNDPALALTLRWLNERQH